MRGVMRGNRDGETDAIHRSRSGTFKHFSSLYLALLYPPPPPPLPLSPLFPLFPHLRTAILSPFPEESGSKLPSFFNRVMVWWAASNASAL